MLHFHSHDRPSALFNREGLDTYLSRLPKKPELVSEQQYGALSPEEKAQHDRARILHLSGGIVLNTPYLHEAKVVLQRCFAQNIGRNSGHTGLILSGRSTVGKTTIAKSLMRYVYNQYARTYPDFRDRDQVPVLYIEVPAASTGKLLMTTFAEFFGMHIRSGESMGNIRSRVVDIIGAAGTQLIVVDELQNLAGRGTGNGESVDLLKTLHNDLPATFVYAGIELTGGALLAGPRGQQLSSRFNILEMEPFQISKPQDRATWRKLLPAFESELPLRDQEPGTLAGLSDYLYQRTGGSIGSLGRLVTDAAIEAIYNRDLPEQVNEALLDTITIDHTAELSNLNSAARKGKARGAKAA
jgi:hypothetical protein